MVKERERDGRPSRWIRTRHCLHDRASATDCAKCRLASRTHSTILCIAIRRIYQIIATEESALEERGLQPAVSLLIAPTNTQVTVCAMGPHRSDMDGLATACIRRRSHSRHTAERAYLIALHDHVPCPFPCVLVSPRQKARRHRILHSPAGPHAKWCALIRPSTDWLAQAKCPASLSCARGAGGCSLPCASVLTTGG